MQPVYSAERSTWHFTCTVLEEARRCEKELPLLRHLIGAILHLRFPDQLVDPQTAICKDAYLGLSHEYIVGQTVFQITNDPFSDIFERACRNRDRGYAVYILVPDRIAAGTKQCAERHAPGQITVAAVESFVAQMLDLLSIAEKRDQRAGLRTLIETYKRRVEAIEADKTLLDRSAAESRGVIVCGRRGAGGAMARVRDVVVRGATDPVPFLAVTRNDEEG